MTKKIFFKNTLFFIFENKKLKTIYGYKSVFPFFFLKIKNYSQKQL